MRLERLFIIAESFVLGVGVYGAVGLVAALALVLRGVARIDPVIVASPRSVRLVLVPGLVALWPVMLYKWMKQARGSSRGEGAQTPEAGD